MNVCCRVALAVAAAGLLVSANVAAQGSGPPPARVVAGTISVGTLSPASEFKGTVYFKEIAELAAEVAGKVVEVHFEEGDEVGVGTPLIRLDDDLLRVQLATARALVKQTQARLQQERVRLERAKQLLDDEITTPQEYDDIAFTVEALAYRVAETESEARRIETEISKKVVRAPFDGVVVSRRTELGEWMNIGSSVATVARRHQYDVIVNIPETNLTWLSPGDVIPITVAGRPFDGTVITVIPRGDAATRTFPVKIRIEDDTPLLEGMSASVFIPIGENVECLFAPRDAVLLDGGEYVLFTIGEGSARRHVVEVLGFEGFFAGIRAPELSAGMQIVVKGHERLRDGQSVLTDAP